MLRGRPIKRIFSGKHFNILRDNPAKTRPRRPTTANHRPHVGFLDPQMQAEQRAMGAVSGRRSLIRMQVCFSTFAPSASSMSLLRLYTRVLELLGKEARLG